MVASESRERRFSLGYRILADSSNRLIHFSILLHGIDVVKASFLWFSFGFQETITTTIWLFRAMTLPSSVRRSLPLARLAVASSTRTYMGGAGEGVANPPTASESVLLQRAKPRAVAIREQHLRLPDLAAIPKGSWGTTTSDYAGDQKDEIRRKRLIYRAKQRGWLEVDVLLGTWASENVPTLSTAELDEFEAFVNTETIDIYNLITLKVQEIPEEFESSGVVQRIQNWAKANPLGKADPAKYKEMKASAKLI